MGKYRIETDKGVYEIETEDAPQQTQQPQQPSRTAEFLRNLPYGGGSFAVGREIAKAAGYEPPSVDTAARDLLRGMGAGVFSTIKGAADLAGIDYGQRPNLSQLVAGKREPSMLENLATPPPGAAGSVGKMLEQGAEFMLPLSGIGRGMQLLRNAPRAVQIGTRAALEAGAAGGVAGVQSGGDPTAMRNAAVLGGTASVLGAGANAIAQRLREGALTQYGRVINPTKAPNKLIAERVIPEMIERRIWGSSLPAIREQAQDQMAHWGAKVDEIWNELEQSGARANVDVVIQRLANEARRIFTVENPAGQAVLVRGPHEHGYRVMEGMAQTLREASLYDPALQQNVVTPATLRRLRQMWDEIADASGAFTKRPRDLHNWVTGVATRYGGDAIRAEMAAARPDLAAINREYSFWNRVRDITEDTMTRRTGQQKPLTRRLAQLQGAFAGGGGVTSILGAIAMDKLQGLISSPAWGTLSAVTKDRLANALAGGNASQARFYLNQALKAAGLETVTRRNEPAGKIPAPQAAR